MQAGSVYQPSTGARLQRTYVSSVLGEVVCWKLDKMRSHACACGAMLPVVLASGELEKAAESVETVETLHRVQLEEKQPATFDEVALMVVGPPL